MVPDTVQKAISLMWEHYDERVTLNRLAKAVYVSPFHFSRMFAKSTGVTPGRYLTAIRFFEAKRLLLTSSETISDVVCSVGYSSVGTFTSRFTQAVGMTPTQYRDPQVGELLLAVAPHFMRVPSVESLRAAGRTCIRIQHDGGTITGKLTVPSGTAPATVLVGAFAEAIPQCGPVAYACLTDVSSTELVIRDVPAGQWSIVAVAQHGTDRSGENTFSLGTASDTVTITGNETVAVDIDLRAPHPSDPPIAITLAADTSPMRARRTNSPLRVLRPAA